ncbi:hypothetical protein FS837_004176 [Tulasnella sp. UAMH 9824]|nr:hypothetical protein FS837_004176 [Tulasnella sp. UAMH 9824]
MKWKVNRRGRQQEQEQQDDCRTEVGDDDVERGDADERPQPRRRDTTASRASVATPLESQIPLPACSLTSPPPPAPASLQPPNTISTTSPPQVQSQDDDDDDPTGMQPPAYRRRNFGIRPHVRPTTAPAALSTPMSPRALEKQRKAEGAGIGEDVSAWLE